MRCTDYPFRHDLIRAQLDALCLQLGRGDAPHRYGVFRPLNVAVRVTRRNMRCLIGYSFG